ncbi:MAG TPA: 3-oxoacyl-ACP reductase, partial [Rhodospirillaceae bacterium]|nr:3-oxoacyl-ACP reductase [Rhodospirillaceae bacterium]
MNRIDLKSHTAIVTGGAQGIGLAIAERLEASGAQVWLWDIDADTANVAAEKIGGKSLKVDVSDPEAVDAAVETVISKTSTIDILVNNAGISGANAPVHKYPVDEWRRVVDVDLSGTFYCCRSVVPHMINSGSGRIVNIASVAGKEGNPNAAAYSAA